MGTPLRGSYQAGSYALSSNLRLVETTASNAPCAARSSFARHGISTAHRLSYNHARATIAARVHLPLRAMSAPHRVIPIVKQSGAAAKPRVHYDCLKCPGYCCSYDLIEVGKRDVARLAKHFEVTYQQAEDRFTKYDGDAKVRTLRHQKDKLFGKICTFFDTKKRQCTIYHARPSLCRAYPNEAHCGYYDFLKFERDHQDDEKYIALTS
jgi:Fe-S-cluster containining protein